jgi:hypothetical protein
MKKLLLLIYIAVFSFNAFAQNPLVKQWDKRFGGTGEEHISFFQQTKDGGYILGGVSNSDSSGDKTQATWCSCINYDYWIVKIDSVGNKQWDKRLGGTNIDNLISLQQTSDGGYILGGNSLSDSSGDKTQNIWGSKDYWIIKTDSLGNKQWDKDFGGTDDDVLYSLHQTTDGGYILGGSSGSGISGDKTQPLWGGTGDADYWIIKIDSLGNKQWDKDFGGTDYDALFSLQQTNDEGYILGGRSNSGISGDKTQGCWGYTDYWIVKIDSVGIKQWDKDFGGISNDQLNSLQQTTDKGYILAGTSLSGIGGNKTQNTHGFYDYWIVKTDSLGNKLWDKDFGGAQCENLYSTQQTSDEGYILAGFSCSDSSGDKTEDNLGQTQTWIIKIDSLGIKQWDKTVFTNTPIGDDMGLAIQTKDGCYAVTNYTSAGIGGYKTQPSWGLFDYWIIKFCDSTLTTNLTPALSKGEGVVIAPNPATDFINISFTSAEKNLQIELVDLFGRKVFQKPFQNKIDIRNLPQGIYILEIKGATVFYKTKLVKQ